MPPLNWIPCCFINALVLLLPADTHRYCTLHCTGYMRSWPTGLLDAESEAEKESAYLTCLVTVCRIHPHASHQPPRDVNVKPTEFVTRFAIDGKFTFVDQQWVSWFSSMSICSNSHLSELWSHGSTEKGLAERSDGDRPLRVKHDFSSRVRSVAMEIILSVFAIVSQKELCISMTSHEHLFSYFGK